MDSTKSVGDEVAELKVRIVEEDVGVEATEVITAVKAGTVAVGVDTVAIAEEEREDIDVAEADVETVAAAILHHNGLSVHHCSTPIR